jgi:RWD domain
MTEDEEFAQALDRAVTEIEALSTIYEDSMTVQSKSELTAVRRALEQSEAIEFRLDISLDLNILTSNTNDIMVHVQLLCGLPPGYPARTAALVSVLVLGWTRKEQDELSARAQQTVNRMIGQEAIMELAQGCAMHQLAAEMAATKIQYETRNNTATRDEHGKRVAMEGPGFGPPHHRQRTMQVDCDRSTRVETRRISKVGLSGHRRRGRLRNRL